MAKALRRISSKVSFLSALLKAKIIHRRIPLIVLFNITNRCNLKCAYCFGQYYNRDSEELTTKEICEVVDQLAELGTRRIGIGGGEPLLRDDLGDIVGYIKNKNIEVGINTNGILLTQKISGIKDADSICISLDGEEEVHDFYRGKGSFKKAMEAIDCCRSNSIETHVSSVITKKNFRSIPFLIELAKKKGLLLQFSFLYGQFGAPENNNYPQGLSESEYKEVCKVLIALKEKGGPIFYSRNTYRNILNWPDYGLERIVGQEPSFKHVKCYAGRYFCHIEANGNVFPCACPDGKKAMNCRRVKFSEIFNNLNHHECNACLWACYNEYNLLFDLNMSTLGNLMVNSLKTIFK